MMDWGTQIWFVSDHGNTTPVPIDTLNCDVSAVLPVCYMAQSDKSKRDALAVLRLVVSALSIIGAASIIYSAIRRKRVCSPKVHPLFVLSIADVLLAILWVLGAVLWLRQSKDMYRGWCFTVSLITIITECAAINLTFVYALLAYFHIRKLDFGIKEHFSNRDGAVLTARTAPELNQKTHVLWHSVRLRLLYLTAWMLPLVLVMVPFAFIVCVSDYKLLENVRDCTCWCEPTFGNVLPASVYTTKETTRYIYELGKILLLYGIVLSTHYVVVFILLVICYIKILRHIRNLKWDYNKYHGARRYGTIKVQLENAHSQAKRRVVAFILVFIITGFSNLIISLMFTIHEARVLSEDVDNIETRLSGSPAPLGVFITFYFQSLTVPMQGFLNAIVYGWTREDFVKSVTDNDDSSTILGQRTVTFNSAKSCSNIEKDDGSLNGSHQSKSSHGSLKRSGMSLSGSTNDTYGHDDNYGQSAEIETDFEGTDLEQESDNEIQVSQRSTMPVYRV